MVRVRADFDRDFKTELKDFRDELEAAKGGKGPNIGLFEGGVNSIGSSEDLIKKFLESLGGQPGSLQIGTPEENMKQLFGQLVQEPTRETFDSIPKAFQIDIEPGTSQSVSFGELQHRPDHPKKGDMFIATQVGVSAAATVAGHTFICYENEIWTQGLAKNTVTETAAPGVTDDLADGYDVGSIWVDITGNLAYMMVDSTIGAAVWIGIAATGGSGGHGESSISFGDEPAAGIPLTP